VLEKKPEPNTSPLPTIITIENLGKRYTLRHQGGGPRYRRLSEELVAALARPFRSLFPVSASPRLPPPRPIITKWTNPWSTRIWPQ
jgi:hypothetical protein